MPASIADPPLRDRDRDRDRDRNSLEALRVACGRMSVCRWAIETDGR
jgi:hypothetical protein